MLTSPLTATQDVEIEQMVRAFCKATFSSARVREASLTVTGMDEVAWKQMVELGWSGLAVAAEFGGAGLGSAAECVVLRELGARLAPTPYLGATALPVAAVQTLMAPETAAPILAAIATDPQSGAALVLGTGGAWNFSAEPSVRARRDNRGWNLDGAVTLVPDAGRAARLLVVAAFPEADRWGLFEVSNRTAEMTRARPTVDTTRRYADVVLEGSPAELRSVALTSVDLARLVDRIAICVAAELIGLGTACLTRSVEYLHTREQFGRAIGSFQALKYRCADVAVALTTAQEAVFAAANLVDSGGEVGVAAPLALARAGEAAQHSAEEAIQLHGGVGFTEECDVGMYYRRVITDLELIAKPVDAYARIEAIRKVGA